MSRVPCGVHAVRCKNSRSETERGTQRGYPVLYASDDAPGDAQRDYPVLYASDDAPGDALDDTG